ncbi:ExbD/TolR family protein [Pseudoalteromonas phenolica]|uniref:ExbD/TolR family protein n=1 Tax=Pseudoalteromonas phenolica TaxID=161398 RepID=UPI00110BDB59|nr:biopolymer transporter ExbD [Pseudoalteromonas phenolica]TMO57251.1 biopolymer transporter ExbD [Pseudoalteromonas phenolica]
MRSAFEEFEEQNLKQDIDLAPLLDVVFILLIFFIVTTVFVKETGVDVNKPKAVSSENLEKSVLLIAITNDNRVIYAGTNVGVNGVYLTLKQELQNEKRPLVIQADKYVTTELLVEVIDQSKLAGIEQISLATEAK